MSDHKAVEGPRSRGEAGSDHVVNYVIDTRGIAVPGVLHQFFHEEEPEILLDGGGIGGKVVILMASLLLLLGFTSSFLRSGHCRADGNYAVSRGGKQRRFE